MYTQSCWINTNAFQEPQFTFGNLRPNAFQAQRYWNVDLSIFRGFPIWREDMKLQFRAEAFNLFNSVIFGPPNNDVSNPGNFGVVAQRGNGNAPRVLQFGLRFIF